MGLSKEKPDLTGLLIALRDAHAKAAEALDAFLKANPPAEVKTADVADLFPADVTPMLIFDIGEKEVIIKPRQYLGSDVFARVAAIVKEHGGSYVSAGKESHFRLPR